MLVLQGPTDIHYAVAVLKEGQVVGHIPYNNWHPLSICSCKETPTKDLQK